MAAPKQSGFSPNPSHGLSSHISCQPYCCWCSKYTYMAKPPHHSPSWPKVHPTWVYVNFCPPYHFYSCFIFSVSISVSLTSKDDLRLPSCLSHPNPHPALFSLQGSPDLYSNTYHNLHFFISLSVDICPGLSPYWNVSYREEIRALYCQKHPFSLFPTILLTQDQAQKMIPERTCQHVGLLKIKMSVSLAR